MSFDITDKRTIDRRTWDEKTSEEILQDIRAAQEWGLPLPKVEAATPKPDFGIKIYPETVERCQAQATYATFMAQLEAGTRQDADQKS